MREQIVESPNLFDAVPEDAVAPESGSTGNSPERVARDFVRWLFSLGPDFRNSPDMTNLKFWLKRQNLDFRNGEEREIAVVARALFSKKLEQMLRKSDPPPPLA